MNKINLICLPYAGASKYAYNDFKQYTPEYIELVPTELPGRGSRYTERLLKDMDTIVDDIFLQVKGHVNVPYAIYGHSMGTLLGYLLVRRIISEGLPEPILLFCTGRGGPSVEMELPHRHTLSKDDFKEEIRDLGGSPDEILEDEDLMEFFEPILRADFEAIETYEHTPGEPFDIPITAIIGDREKATYEEAQEWKKVTQGDVDIRIFPGKHFFIFNNTREIIKLITQKITKYGREVNVS
ncbi:MAG: thioesterase domain-containing protein [Bacteroidota bacterium]